jgi:hypothetical protein
MTFLSISEPKVKSMCSYQSIANITVINYTASFSTKANIMEEIRCSCLHDILRFHNLIDF